MSGLLCQGKFGAFGWAVEAFLSQISYCGPWGGDRGQGERFQGGVGGLGMPPLLWDRLPNFEGPRAARGATLPGSSLRRISRHPPQTFVPAHPLPRASAPCPHTVPCLLPLTPKMPGLRSSRHISRVCAGLPGVVTLHLWPWSLPRVYTH